MEVNIRKTIIVSIDGLGVGQLPDSELYEDRGTNSLGHTADTVGSIAIPNLSKLGLGNLTYTRGAERTTDTLAFYGKCRCRSEGNDAVTGHWEIAGVTLKEPFSSFADGPNDEFLEMLTAATHRKFLIFKIDREEGLLNTYGAEHLFSSSPILICSHQSELLVCAHESILTPAQLRSLTMDVRDVANVFQIALVSSLPLEGEPGDFFLNYQLRTDFSMPAPDPTLLDSAEQSGLPVITLGDIPRLFANRGISTGLEYDDTPDFFEKLMKYIRESPSNDFDQAVIWARYDKLFIEGTRARNPQKFASALEEFDLLLPRLYRAMQNEDMLILTAPSGGDPTTPKGDTTREHVPMLAYCRMFKPHGNGALPVRKSVADIAETIADAYELQTHFAADSFWSKMVEKL